MSPVPGMRRRVAAALLVLPTLLLSLRTAHADEEGWAFVRGINLNGDAVVIDGHRYEADRDAKDFVCRDSRFENQKVQLQPGTDDARARMIRSSRWKPDGNNAIRLTNLTKGRYRVYLYTWEDSDPERFTISLEGRPVLKDHNSGKAGTWKKLGPWDVAVDDGTLELTCRGGHANLSGLELWRQTDGAVAAADAPSRSGLLALYMFDESDGAVVHDRSGVGEPLNLTIADPSKVTWDSGRLTVRSATRIASSRPAAKISDAVRRSGEITVEAWIGPENTKQSGPARIVTISGDPNRRNVTLGQDGDRYDIRLRTTSTSTNGIPSVATGSKTVRTDLTHVVYTRDRTGQARVYVDGRQQRAERIGGDLKNWDRSFRLGLANELSGDRSWLGELHAVAIYGRALSPSEVAQSFRLGAEGTQELLAGGAPETASAAERMFEAEIAPILARHCLECHDGATKKGGLDLSRRDHALTGGESGLAFVAGKPGESLLLDLVESDDMPADREPLSDVEKKKLRRWIEAGAAWSLELVDPAIYAQDAPTGSLFVQRLTVPEYIETVRSTVGVDISEEARELLPPDVRADGFTNTAYNLNVDLKHVEAYARLAEIIVRRMDVPAFARRFSKSRSIEDNPMKKLIGQMGRYLLRGPLDENEITVFRGVASTVAAAGGDFDEAVTYTLAAMLQSPRFIYRIEHQRGDGTWWPVGSYELASRLSYIIVGGPPDDALLQAAERGELADPDRCRAHVDRLLQDPRARARSQQFLTEWLDLERLEHMQPGKERFPDWSPELAADMRAETLAYFDDVVWEQKQPLTALLNAPFTYATPQLAEHYGLPSDEGATTERRSTNGRRLRRYDLTKIPERGGLLTQASLLTVGGDDASMVTRGLFVLTDLLRGRVGDPPPCVDTTPVPTKAGLTQRAIAEARIADAQCGVCHVKFEPFAFGLEKFDGIGRWHDRDEHGNRLRDDGEIVIPGSDQRIAYRSSAELMDVLAESDRVRECITWKLTQFAIGRPPGVAEAAIVREIHQAAWQDGGTYPDLIRTIVLSDLVQKTRTEPETTP
ncbi:DUF1592 domain-containing protein [Maioricimonas sp. JC845]|uniref:DUF1592 domain-containing protein n=1 Tax=Maioricimonas sp. JC845 TaxID=3232138 RepID=UPI0034576031